MPAIWIDGPCLADIGRDVGAFCDAKMTDSLAGGGGSGFFAVGSRRAALVRACRFKFGRGAAVARCSGPLLRGVVKRSAATRSRANAMAALMADASTRFTERAVAAPDKVHGAGLTCPLSFAVASPRAVEARSDSRADSGRRALPPWSGGPLRFWDSARDAVTGRADFSARLLFR